MLWLAHIPSEPFLSHIYSNALPQETALPTYEHIAPGPSINNNLRLESLHITLINCEI
jgi:hypothetical protein